MYHDELCHIGVDKTISKIREQFWFPRMNAFVRKYISHCLNCVSNKKLPGPKQGFLHSIDKKPIPFHIIHADCVGPFKTTSDGYKHILLLMDGFTKYIFLIPLKSLTGVEMRDKLELYLTLFGTPSLIITDRGTNFTDKNVTQLIKSFKIEHHLVATGASRANGQVERYVATVTTMLRAEINNGSEWTRAVPKIQLTLNSSIQKSTGFSPLRLLIGVNANNAPIQGLIDSIGGGVHCNLDIASDRALAYSRLQQNAAAQKKRFDEHRRNNHTFLMNDFVFVPKSNARAAKLEPEFRGPYKIVEILPGDRFKVENKRFKRGPLIIAKDHLKLWPGEWTDEFVSENENENETQQ
ncbi:uncharacterized protein K02A2.6-like [Anthonomus grandis grandis]|uniref:uncharacterized protein K02A2.6-like n=1 Tax=Anthonomus grandis grandis TaxID=2921223 RepID=UPI00216591A7|nr:uncharacterized protein K02A2.6-like [Anthonomus grandis grandis]